MTVQEVRLIKEEKSQLTKNMSLAQLKEYYANSLREFILVMDDISESSYGDVPVNVVAENRSEYMATQCPTVNKRLALFGCAKGKVAISDDFDEEMDEYGRFKSEPDFGKPVKEGWE